MRRRVPKQVQRDRRRVTRALKVALARISEHDPTLGSTLREAIETGQFFSYSPKGAAFRRKLKRRGVTTIPEPKAS